MQLQGDLNGVKLAFDFTPPNLFTGIIPQQPTGSYVISLYAIDDAGNQTYYADALIIIQYDKIEVRILPETRHERIKDVLYAMEIENPAYIGKPLDSTWGYKELSL